MSGKKCNGWLEGRLRFIGSIAIVVATLVAGVMVFAWRSQASQDVKIGENKTGNAVTASKVDGLKDQLGKMDVKLDKVLDRLPRP